MLIYYGFPEINDKRHYFSHFLVYQKKEISYPLSRAIESNRISRLRKNETLYPPERYKVMEEVAFVKMTIHNARIENSCMA